MQFQDGVELSSKMPCYAVIGWSFCLMPADSVSAGEAQWDAAVVMSHVIYQLSTDISEHHTRVRVSLKSSTRL